MTNSGNYHIEEVNDIQLQVMILPAIETQAQLDMSTVANGMYAYKVIVDGVTKHHGKIVKQ